jgi:hypothetical protein
MYPYQSGPHGTVVAHPEDLLRVARDGQYLAAQYLAVAERREKYVAEAVRAWELRQAGIDPVRGRAIVAVVRRAVGAALVRTGQRIQGTHRPETMAGSAGAAG